MTRVEQAAERKTARAVPEAADGELLGSEAAELVAAFTFSKESPITAMSRFSLRSQLAQQSPPTSTSE